MQNFFYYIHRINIYIPDNNRHLCFLLTKRYHEMTIDSRHTENDTTKQVIDVEIAILTNCNKIMCISTLKTSTLCNIYCNFSRETHIETVTNASNVERFEVRDRGAFNRWLIMECEIEEWLDIFKRALSQYHTTAFDNYDCMKLDQSERILYFYCSSILVLVNQISIFNPYCLI